MLQGPAKGCSTTEACEASVVLTAQLCLTLRPHGLQPTRLLCPWNSPVKNTGASSHSLLQGIFPIQGSNLRLPHCRHILYRLSHQGSPDIRCCLPEKELRKEIPEVSEYIPIRDYERFNELFKNVDKDLNKSGGFLVFLPGKLHGSSLAGYSSWGCKRVKTQFSN